MKKIAGIICFGLLAVVGWQIISNTAENEHFKSNTGFDDLSRAIETAISQNPAAAMVFGMESPQAVEVFERVEQEI